jgi:hypothetical protein
MLLGRVLAHHAVGAKALKLKAGSLGLLKRSAVVGSRKVGRRGAISISRGAVVEAGSSVLFRQKDAALGRFLNREFTFF